MTVFTAPEFDDHERVVFVRDASVGLRAIIAIHRQMRSAGGGIRMKPYGSEGEALADALRLSRAMTYKWAFAGPRVGGAKTVVIGDPRAEKTEALLHALGRAIDALGGAYVAGSDVGTSHADMQVIQQVTPHVRGADPDHGDSSEATAYGVLQGVLAACRHVFGTDDLAGRSVAVQGVGHVGAQLCAFLAARGARLTVADVDSAAVRQVVAAHAAREVPPDAILDQPCDVLAPCALGGVLNAATVPRLQARIVCGAANNQLADAAQGPALHARGVLYVPDYVVNAGGVINGAAEGPDYDRARVWTRLARIGATCERIFARAASDGVDPEAAAEAIGRELIAARS